jgi:hypothetical protein
MGESPAFLVINAYLALHKRILEFSGKLSHSQLTWQARPDSLPIVFYLWHLRRWADHLQASLPGMTSELSQRFPPGKQVWDEVKKSQPWSSFSEALGYAETGMSIWLHLPVLKSHSNAVIQAICGRNRSHAAEMAAKYEIPSVFTNYQEMPVPAEFLHGSYRDEQPWDQQVNTFKKQSIGTRLFIDGILEERPVEPSFYEGMKAQEVIEAAVQSQETGSWVNIK